MILDLIVLGLVGLAVVGGWRRGGAAIALHVVGLLVGLIVGLRVAGLVSASLSPAAHVLLGALCALGGLVVGGALGRRAGARVSIGAARMHLGVLDRALGALTRGLGAAVAIWVVLAVVVAVGPARWAASIRGSRPAGDTIGLPVLGPLVHGVGRAIGAAAPADVAALVPDLDPGRTSRATIHRIDAQVAGSVFEIGATGCHGAVVGTAFVVARDSTGELVVTNAHVVRGARVATLYTGDGDVQAVPVLLDRRADLAVLHVDGLDAAVLPLAATGAANGTHAVVVGYPHGGPRRAVGAVVVQRLPVPDPGLSDGLALHMSYRLVSDIEHGNSGSPLLGPRGRVLGVVDATAGAGTEQGYAITVDELRPDLRAARNATTAAEPAACT